MTLTTKTAFLFSSAPEENTSAAPSETHSTWRKIVYSQHLKENICSTVWKVHTTASSSILNTWRNNICSIIWSTPSSILSTGSVVEMQNASLMLWQRGTSKNNSIYFPCFHCCSCCVAATHATDAVDFYCCGCFAVAVAVVAVACCVNVSAAAALAVAVVSGVAVWTYLFHHSSTPVEFTVEYTEYSFGLSLHIAT